MKHLLVWDGDLGMVVLTPETLKTMEPEDVQKFLDYVNELVRKANKPKRGPFHCPGCGRMDC